MTNNFFSIAVTLLITLTFSLANISDAQAKRFGGGGSFGSRSIYSTPYRRSTANLPSRSARQQQAYQKNQTIKQNLSRRGGLMGMLGALAIGGLLGSLFFGGAFQGFNFLDILILGGIAYLLYRMFAAKTAQRQTPAYQRNDYHDNYIQPEADDAADNRQPQGQTGGFDTDLLFGKNRAKSGHTHGNLQQDATFEPESIPAGFDETQFLAGAKTAFHRLQHAWDHRDLAQIRGLTTDKVFSEIRQQLEEHDEFNQTDVLNLQAELLEIRELGTELEATVLFDALLREHPEQQPEPVQEIWHFTKPVHSLQPTWFLDGIQQLDN